LHIVENWKIRIVTFVDTTGIKGLSRSDI